MAYTEQWIKNAESEGLLWYRVEVDRKDGSIKSCAEGEYASSPSGFIRYVQANSREGAIAKVQTWYREKLEKARRRQNRHIEQKKARDLCTYSGCNRNSTPGRVHCQECLDKRAANRKRRLLDHGTDKTPARANPLMVFENHRDRSARHHERTRVEYGGNAAYLYTRLLRRFDECGPVAFRAWLMAQIIKNGGSVESWHPPMSFEEPMAEAAE